MKASFPFCESLAIVCSCPVTQQGNCRRVLDIRRHLIRLANLLVQLFPQLRITQLLIYRIYQGLKWLHIRLHDGHASLSHLLLCILNLAHNICGSGLAHLNRGLNQKGLQIFRQAFKPALATDQALHQLEMPGLGLGIAHLIDPGGEGGCILGLTAFNGLGLNPIIYLSPGHGNRSRSHGGQGFGTYLLADGADTQSF